MESATQQPLVTMISGPVVKARPAHRFSMNEMVEVGDERLVGEVIDLDEDLATIQVYEDTTGLRPGADVYAKGLPLYVELGPGLMGEIFDGVQRPLEILRGKWGDFIRRGKTGTALPRDRVWQFTPVSYTHLTLPTICSV